VLIVVVACAAIIGDTIGYELGRYLGRGWLLTHGKRVGLGEEHLDRVDRFIANHGGKAVFASHFMHLLRALMPFVAGASRMPYTRFLFFNGAGCWVWATLFACVGYIVGESWQVAAKWMGRGSEVVGGVVVLAIALTWLWRWLGRHETDVKQSWQPVADLSRTVVMRRVAAKPRVLPWRFAPYGYLLTHLVGGALLLAGLAWLFARLAEGITVGDSLTHVDAHVAAWFHGRTTHGMTTAMQVVTGLASTAWIAVVTVFTAFVLWRKRCVYRLLALAPIFREWENACA